MKQTETKTASLVDRIPPHNLEAEMALIGSILVDGRIMSNVLPYVCPADFYAHVHESIFGVLVCLHETGAPLDKITVAEELKKRDLLDKVGGLSYISSLMDTVQTAASAVYYARIVREKSKLRSLIHAGGQITLLGYEAEEDVDAALDRSAEMVLGISTRDTSDSVTVHQSALQIVRDITNGITPGIETGFSVIDSHTFGLHPGRVYLLAARPSVGKTSLALDIARNVAERYGHVHVHSAEMPHKDLTQRLIAQEANIDTRQLQSYKLSRTEEEAVMRAAGTVAELRITIDDTSGSIEQVVASARQHFVRYAPKLFIVDYIQLLGCEDIRRDANTNERLTYISQRLVRLSKELQTPFLVLSQLNREIEKRADKRPMLSDLRDCGSLEQDAACVMFLHRDWIYDKSADPSNGQVIIAKNRYGPTGEGDVRFVPLCAHYKDAA